MRNANCKGLAKLEDYIDLLPILMSLTDSHSTWELEAERSGVQGQPHHTVD